ncbi:MAG: anthranilate phosphoribosyltransferase [Gammaproteobacteria bacterium]|nr:anthranilate phosphoribosyltransferase [Gammaproteobacteria bacterium]MBA3732296.1 anthranilate phosphoribosyltransferase [Gammaproteobacteria bacterium]
MSTAESSSVRDLHACIGKIATGPEFSKNLSFSEAYGAMRHILAGTVDPVQSGVFLIALRMKRETDAENAGALRAIADVTTTATADVDDVLDIADPYDGFARCLPVSPFLPAVLAACGVPTISHGLESVAPKFGVTPRQVLRAAGIDVDLDVRQAAARLSNALTGWGYVDQQAFCPALHALTGLRALIVKRPVISTVENLTGPVRGRQRTHLLTGYVHKAYPPVYARLARASGFASAAVIRGIEGGVLASLRQPAKVHVYHEGGELESREVNPADLNIDYPFRALPLPSALVGQKIEDNPESALGTDSAASAAAQAGLAALAGEPGAARDSLVYGGAIALTHLRRFDTLRAAAEVVRSALDTGAARAKFTDG